MMAITRSPGTLLCSFCFAFLTSLGAEPAPGIPDNMATPGIPADALPGSRWEALDNFEAPGRWELQRPKFSDQSESIQASDLFDGPYAGSGAYISVLFQGSRSTPAVLEPQQPIRLPGFCQNLGLFVYGWNQPVRMILVLKDRNGRKVRSGSQSLQFEGWQRIQFELDHNLERKPAGPFQDWYLELVGLEISPIYEDSLPVRFSLDDLMVLTAPPLKLAPPVGKP
ncbi:MAG: hypothetical protein KDK25_10475 [Leptospiraceae bacterium]|nr:hypothetical protein [Leptospiraceae bacterium]